MYYLACIRNATYVYTYVALLRPRRLSSHVSNCLRVQIVMRASCVGVALLAVCLVVCDMGQVPDQDDIIRDYFEMGFSYQLINYYVPFGYYVSLSTLKRSLGTAGT